MAQDHVDEEVASAAGPLLFSCPACNCYLELEGKRDFQRHVDRCKGGTASENESGDDHNAQQRISVTTSLPSFKCKSCGSKFSSLSEFDQHVIRDGDPAKCEIVPDVGEGDAAVAIHFAKFKKLTCDRCDFAFTAIADEPNLKCSRVQMAKHYETEHGVEGMWLCGKPGCDFRTDCPKLRLNHKRQEKGKIQCEICGITVSASGISNHMRVHEDVTYDCEHCSRPYGSGHALK